MFDIHIRSRDNNCYVLDFHRASANLRTISDGLNLKLLHRVSVDELSFDLKTVVVNVDAVKRNVRRAFAYTINR